MTKKLKPHTVANVRSPSGHVERPVYFDREEKDFYVEIAEGDVVRAPSVAEVQKRAKERLGATVPYTWKGIIIIEVKDSWEQQNNTFYRRSAAEFGSALGFEFSRLERSPHPSKEGKFVTRKHTLDFEASLKDSADYWVTSAQAERERNEGVTAYHDIDSTVVLPYSDETWNGLLAIKSIIDEAHAKLETFMRQPDVSVRLDLAGKKHQAPMLLPSELLTWVPQKKKARR